MKKRLSHDYRIFVGAFPIGDLADRIQALRQRHDPKTARITAPHVTLAGTYWRTGPATPENESDTIAHLQAAPIVEAAWVVGHVHLGYVPFVFLGSQVGSPLGTRLNTVLTLPRRRVVLGVALLIITVRVLFRLFG